jgi:hypothetical protein
MFDVRSGKYVGFLDVRDLIAFIVFEAKEKVKAKAEHGAHGAMDRVKYVTTLPLRLCANANTRNAQHTHVPFHPTPTQTLALRV